MMDDDEFFEGQGMFNGDVIQTEPQGATQMQCEAISHKGMKWERRCRRLGVVNSEGRMLCKQHAHLSKKWKSAAERDRLKLELFGELVECLRYAYGFVGDDEDTTRPETKAEVFEQCKRIRAVLDKAAAIEGRTRA